jgi:hypothetical protein
VGRTSIFLQGCFSILMGYRLFLFTAST